MGECRHCGRSIANPANLAQHETSCGNLTPNALKRRRDENQEEAVRVAVEEAAKKVAAEEAAKQALEAAQAAYNAAKKDNEVLERKAAEASNSQGQQLQLLQAQMSEVQRALASLPQLNQQQPQQLPQQADLATLIHALLDQQRPQEPQRRDDVPLCDVKDVREWSDIISRDYEKLQMQLETRFLAGREQLPGGHVLKEDLYDWVRAVAGVEDWENVPGLVSLGNKLLTRLRVQWHYVVNKVPHRQLRAQLDRDDPALNRVDKAASALLGKAKAQAKAPRKPGANTSYKPPGNGKAGGM